MKGIELPMNTIVVIILVLIVLVAILGLFYGVWPTGVQTTNLESIKDNACQMFVSTGGCDSNDNIATAKIYISNFDADRDGTLGDVGTTVGACSGTADVAKDNLFMLCKCWYSVASDSDCRTQVCHCSTG